MTRAALLLSGWLRNVSHECGTSCRRAKEKVARRNLGIFLLYKGGISGPASTWLRYLTNIGTPKASEKQSQKPCLRRFCARAWCAQTSAKVCANRPEGSRKLAGRFAQRVGKVSAKPGRASSYEGLRKWQRWFARLLAEVRANGLQGFQAD